MEFLNKIELKGFVGRVNTHKIGRSCTTRFAVATYYVYKDKHGNAITEITWFSCSTIPAENPLHGEIKVGDNIHLVGRMKSINYFDQAGNSHNAVEVIVQSFEIIHHTKESV